MDQMPGFEHGQTSVPISRAEAVRQQFGVDERGFEVVWDDFYDLCLKKANGNEEVARQMMSDKLESLLTVDQKAQIAELSAKVTIDTMNDIKSSQEEIFKESR